MQKDDIHNKPRYQPKDTGKTHIDPKSGYREKTYKYPSLSKKDSETWHKRDAGVETAKQKLNRMSQRVKVKATGEPTLSPKRQKSFAFEEVEQTDEARKMSRIEWRTGTPGDVAKNHQKIYKKLLSTDPEKAERFLKSVKGMKKEVQANEAADPGETKVVNKKKASAAADRIVKIAKSKVNKVNMDPELNHDVKQSSRY